jgi:hypothetical protein
MLEDYDLSDRPGADAGLLVRSRPDWVDSATASSASLRNASSSCTRAKRMAAAWAAAAVMNPACWVPSTNADQVLGPVLVHYAVVAVPTRTTPI